MIPPKLLVLSALATALVLPRPVAAGGDEAVAAIGGFIGGMIVGAHLEHDHHDRGHRHIARHAPPPRVVVIDQHHPRGGYWSERTVKVWVPGRTYWSRDDCGRRIRVQEGGHYEYRRERVWVEGRHHRRW